MLSNGFTFIFHMSKNLFIAFALVIVIFLFMQYYNNGSEIPLLNEKLQQTNPGQTIKNIAESSVTVTKYYRNTPVKCKIHKLAQNEDFVDVANQYHVSCRYLKLLNSLTNTSKLATGTILYVPIKQ